MGINLGYCGNVISSSLNALFSYFPPGTLPVLAGTSALPPGHICPSPRAHLPVPPNCLLDSELTPPLLSFYSLPLPLLNPYFHLENILITPPQALTSQLIKPTTTNTNEPILTHKIYHKHEIKLTSKYKHEDKHKK